MMPGVDSFAGNSSERISDTENVETQVPLNCSSGKRSLLEDNLDEPAQKQQKVEAADYFRALVLGPATPPADLLQRIHARNDQIQKNLEAKQTALVGVDTSDNDAHIHEICAQTVSEVCPELRGLTLQQPWATAIWKGAKRIENRSWVTQLNSEGLGGEGRWLAIHAGQGKAKGPVWDGVSKIWPEYNPDKTDETFYPKSKIIGVAHLYKMAAYDEVSSDAWAIKGNWCWLIDQVVPLERHLQFRGQLGLFKMPMEVQMVIAQQIVGISPTSDEWSRAEQAIAVSQSKKRK
jgi:hypothetical protein